MLHYAPWMSPPGTVVLRRSWPQRFVILASVGVISAAIATAWFIDDIYQSVTTVGRVEISGAVLLSDNMPGAPVNFLLIGEDSAQGLDPDDPAAFAREVDPRGTFNADSITILRVDPGSGQAWVLSIPRDLLIADRGRQRKINQVFLVEGPERLVEVVTETFGIPLNHYMSLGFLGFREVVDELDGIPVWFDHPARDLGSGLDVREAGCTVLDGVRGLQYVRARKYRELIDGEWTTVGNSDFGRIERQQDFIVLALDRAIERGARSPATLATLIEAGARSIVLDDELTVAELIGVGEAFSDFNPDNLERYGVEVSPEFDAAGNYLGELLIPNVNEPVFSVFKGGLDLPPPAAVSFSLHGRTEDSVASGIEQFEALGFSVEAGFVIDTVETGNIVVHPPGQLGEAETIARYLEPIPRLVEDPGADGVRLVLGSDQEQILFLFPHEVAKMRREVGAHWPGPIPDLGGAVPIGATNSAPTSSTSTTSVVTATDETVAPDTTTTIVAEPSAPTTRAGVIGRAPEGESCG